MATMPPRPIPTKAWSGGEGLYAAAVAVGQWRNLVLPRRHGTCGAWRMERHQRGAHARGSMTPMRSTTLHGMALRYELDCPPAADVHQWDGALQPLCHARQRKLVWARHHRRVCRVDLFVPGDAGLGTHILTYTTSRRRRRPACSVTVSDSA